MKRLCIAMIALAAACPFVARSEIRLIPGVPLLFADDSVLESRTNVVRIVHQGKPDAKWVIGDIDAAPWERDANGHAHPHMYGSVYPKDDGTGYRMWYGGRYGMVHVADSVDGVNWTKPILNICNIGGSTSNNVVIKSLAGPSVLRDLFEKDPSRRYKIVGCHYHKPGNPKTGFYTMTSPDGLHWSNERQIVRGWWDTSTLSQNPYTGEYLVYHKHEIPELGCTRRVVFLARSKDFINWSEPVRVFGADEVDDGAWIDNPMQFTDIYMMSVIPHVGGFIGIPSIFRMDRHISNPDKSLAQSAHDGPLYLAFASSADGVNWIRDAGRRALLPNNPRGVYNRSYPGCSSGGPGALLHVGDETWLYTYCGSGLHGTGYTDSIPGVPRNSIGRAVWRRWGFVSLETARRPGTRSETGYIRTVPLIFAKPNLAINAQGEHVKVCVLDEDGKIVSTAKFSGDATRAALAWDRPPPVGRPVHLKFELARAALYAVETP